MTRSSRPKASPDTSAPDKRFIIVFNLAIITVGLLAQGFLATDYYVGLYNDDAGYLLKSWGLAFSGRCPICSLPFEPAGNPYAIGWPLFLVPFSLLFGGSLTLYRGISVTLTIITVLLAADLCRKRWGKLPAAMVALVLLFGESASDYGSTLMSEPFYAALVMLVVWLERFDDSWRHEVLQWSLAVLCAYTRAEGLVVVIALLLVRGLRKSWKLGLLYPAAFLVCWFLIKKSGLTAGGDHLDQSTTFFRADFPLWAYLIAWFKNQALLVGRAFFYGPAWLDRMFAVGLAALALYGAWMSPPRRPWLGHWLILGTSGALLLWPYLGSRYWLVTLPLWLIAALMVLPRRGQVIFLGATLVLQAGSWLAKERNRVDLEPTYELYKRLEGIETDEIVSSTHTFRAHAIAHRQSSPYQGAESLGPIARNLSVAGVPLLLWERNSNLIRNMEGKTQFSYPPFLDLWLERSTLFEVLYKSEAGVIVRLVAPKDKLEKAFDMWRQALAAQTLEDRKQSLSRGLQALPDLPELRVLWIYAALESQATVPAETSSYILNYFRQYPHDFDNAQVVVQALVQRGARATAEAVALLCYNEALRIGDSKSQRVFKTRKS
jgi:hypothetical protein